MTTIPRHGESEGPPESSGIDLESQEIYDSQGRRIDQAYVDDVVAFAHDVLTRPVGRPSLTGLSTHSPQVSFRVAPAMKESATQLAAQRGMSVSSLARQALADLLAQEVQPQDP